VEFVTSKLPAPVFERRLLNPFHACCTDRELLPERARRPGEFISSGG
jgi:hypothetical protein